MQETELTITALTVAGIVAPWITEFIKKFIGDPSGKKALLTSIIVSGLIATGVLWYQGALDLTNPTGLFVSIGLVVGIANAVYQFLQKQVQEPVAKVTTKLLN